jgi:hypothetical protein
MGSKIFTDQVTECGGAMSRGKGMHLIYQAIASGSSGLSFSGAAQSQGGLILQQFNVQTQRPIEMVFDLTTQYAYYVAGKAQTQLNVQKMVGPVGAVTDFYSTFGDVCKSTFNLVWFIPTPNKCSNFWKDLAAMGGETVIETGSVSLSKVGFSSSVQNFMVTETCDMQGSDVRLTSVTMGATVAATADALRTEARVAGRAYTDQITTTP